MTMREVIIVVCIFYVGVFAGFILRSWLGTKKSYDGVIVITKSLDKQLYSIELADDPEMIMFEENILLKVEVKNEDESRE